MTEMTNGVGGGAELTRHMARFVTSTRYADLPAAVVEESRRLLLDTVGCALGAINTQSGQIARQYVEDLGGNPKATGLGLGAKTSATSAAYLNARLANVLDADDTFPTSAHFGNATVFAALAMAEHFGRSDRDLMTSIAVGFDVGARVGSWMGAPFQVRDGEVVGWNELGGPSSSVVWAAVGAAANIAKLDPMQANHAFGMAAANSPQPTIRKWAEAKIQPMYKYADAGWCADAGVSAALLARLGSTGFLDILDGDNAFWRTYGSPGHDDGVLLAGLGEEWQILNTTYKEWPCCRWIHHPLTAFARLIGEHGLQAEEIERVVVHANPLALTGIFREQQPADPLTAEFSHPHAMAALAHGIPAGPRWYEDEAMTAPHMVDFRGRVRVLPEPSSSNIAEWMGGGQWRGIPGGVEVHARGTVFEATADYALGDPWSEDTRLSNGGLVEKFVRMCRADSDSHLREQAESCAAAILNADSDTGLSPWVRNIGALALELRQSADALPL
ncbi:MmgE/PrpD family protein [Arthrobacter sp. MMS18-M83]|uniref:MmgE/PrpD family protein n=1 Tax=Arthrobacter sp. MMS18-M83 TaxID=2996261 RepID=UPI00227CB988|nr:MmgE/PrpD family protein [Arthrobacter sp. MMS18-M83]WAH96312.1 MmgE/PrpD family protein [Arthrobacter sp. MMS18-M83]